MLMNLNIHIKFKKNSLDFDIHKVYNLPLKCGIDFNFLNKFYNNYGFVIYSSLIIITLLSCIIYSILHKKLNKDAIINDLKNKKKSNTI